MNIESVSTNNRKINLLAGTVEHSVILTHGTKFIERPMDCINFSISQSNFTRLRCCNLITIIDGMDRFKVITSTLRRKDAKPLSADYLHEPRLMPLKLMEELYLNDATACT